MKAVNILLFLLCGLTTVAQFGENPYRLTKEIDDSVKKDTVPWKYQFASYSYSFIGAYAQTLSVADSQYNFLKKAAQLSAKDSQYVAGFSPVPAVDYIVKRAAKEQIIIINEAHYQPVHRAFVRSLLPGLYKLGYRYLGIETLAYDDSLLNQRKYPVLETGFYSREPQFGNMIREALRLGFILFPYETQDPKHNGKEREIDHARNIVHFMDQHKNGKFLIYCGYEHVIEGSHRSWEKAMAGRLKEYTGIDPLTINQEALTEHSQPLYERADYAAIHAAVPSVLVNKNNEVYNGYTGDTLYDIRLFHPRTVYIDGRPNWVRNKYNISYILPANVKISYPFLAKAYAAGEDPDRAVPIDVIEIKGREDKTPLLLTRGNFLIVVEGELSQREQWQVSIK